MKRTFKGSKSTDYLFPRPQYEHQCQTCGQQFWAHRDCSLERHYCSKTSKIKLLRKVTQQEALDLGADIKTAARRTK